MKFIGKLLLTLLLLIVLAVVVLCTVGQTRWAAGRLSARISDNSEYRLSIGKITHSWSQPDQIALEDVQLARNGQPQALVANRVDLGLSLRQITEPRYFHSVTLRDGIVERAAAGYGAACTGRRAAAEQHGVAVQR